MLDRLKKLIGDLTEHDKALDTEYNDGMVDGYTSELLVDDCPTRSVMLFNCRACRSCCAMSSEGPEQDNAGATQGPQLVRGLVSLCVCGKLSATFRTFQFQLRDLSAVRCVQSLMMEPRIKSLC